MVECRKARDVGLTCRCHLSDIMLDSIFYDSMGLGIFFWEGEGRGDNHCFPQHRRDGFSLFIITRIGAGKLYNYNGLRQMGSISLQ